jgi:hypothetical protein
VGPLCVSSTLGLLRSLRFLLATEAYNFDSSPVPRPHIFSITLLHARISIATKPHRFWTGKRRGAFLCSNLGLNMSQQLIHDNMSPELDKMTWIWWIKGEHLVKSASKSCHRSFSTSKTAWVFNNFSVLILMWRLLLKKLKKEHPTKGKWKRLLTVNPSSKN